MVLRFTDLPSVLPADQLPSIVGILLVRRSSEVCETVISTHTVWFLCSVDADCAILMFDVTSRSSYDSLANWHRDLTSVCGNIPIVMVGNKCDMKERRVKTKMINFHQRKNMPYFDISAKSNYNFEKPFRWLARKLTQTPDLQFSEALAIKPPEVVFDENAYKVANDMPANVPLPDDNDDL